MASIIRPNLKKRFLSLFQKRRNSPDAYISKEDIEVCDRGCNCDGKPRKGSIIFGKVRHSVSVIAQKSSKIIGKAKGVFQKFSPKNIFRKKQSVVIRTHEKK
jgi:hypothetical protein